MMSEGKNEAQVSENTQITRPPTNQLICRNLIKNLFDFDINKIKELNGYDDRNYYVITSDSNEFVLKITNSFESNVCGLIDAFNSMILHLNDRDINVTVPIINNKGKYVSFEKFSTQDSNQSETYAVRLLKFVPGKRLYDIPYTPSILRECGTLLAKMIIALESFDNNVLRTRYPIWSLLNISHVRERLFVVNNESHKNIVSDIISRFQTEVLSHINDFEHGFIHGDFNEQNIIVQKSQNCDDWHVNGVIDFGDVHFGPKIFDLAIFLTYTILECKLMDPILAPGFGISGYMQLMKIKESDLKILIICVKTRLCQSLVLGAHAHLIDPTNQYVLTTAKTGWTILERLHQIDENQLLNKWIHIENQFK